MGVGVYIGVSIGVYTGVYIGAGAALPPTRPAPAHKAVAFVYLTLFYFFSFSFFFSSLRYRTLCVELLLQQSDAQRLLLLLPRAPLLLTLVTSVSVLLYQ